MHTLALMPFDRMSWGMAQDMPQDIRSNLLLFNCFKTYKNVSDNCPDLKLKLIGRGPALVFAGGREDQCCTICAASSACMLRAETGPKIFDLCIVLATTAARGFTKFKLKQSQACDVYSQFTI
eukprot:356657-Chlamydomonas_euryale.AAC.2